MNDCSYVEINHQEADMTERQYFLENLDCANCAAKIEEKFNALPEVEKATVTFVTRQLRLTARDPDALIPKLQQLARTVEPEVTICSRDPHHHHGEHHHHEDGHHCCGGHEHHHEDGHHCCGHHDHEHHHHGEDHHGEDHHCCGHHDHDHHNHDHEHHHHHEDGHCSCGHDHHHHHADEVFTSWGVETTKKFTAEEIEAALQKLDTRELGFVLRAKGIVAAQDGNWIHFDYVPGEQNVRTGSAAVTGKLCVIGSELKEAEIAALFGV